MSPGMENLATGEGPVARAEEIKAVNNQGNSLPRKKFYRARAHCNPLSDSQFPVCVPATRFHTAAAASSCPLRRAPTRSPRVHLARERRANPARSSSRASTVNPTPSVARLTTPRASPAPLPRRLIRPEYNWEAHYPSSSPRPRRRTRTRGAPRSIRGRRVRVRRTARSTVAAVSERSRRGCVSGFLPRGQNELVSAWRRSRLPISSP